MDQSRYTKELLHILFRTVFMFIRNVCGTTRFWKPVSNMQDIRGITDKSVNERSL